MKKQSFIISIILSLVLLLTAGCSSKNTASTAGGNTPSSTPSSTPAPKATKLVVGASPVPHAEILDFIKPLLKEKGIELEVKEFTDYVTPNTALNDKQIDANFFQHTPYLDDFNKKQNMQLVAVGKVHVEPMGIYSKKVKSLDELKDGAIVAVPNDATNEGRALLLLQKQGIIKLKSDTELTQTPKDIIENTKNLKFKELEAPQLPRVLEDVSIAVINTNFALEGKLDPTKDAIASEGKDSPYANIVTARPDNQNDPAIKELVNVLNSEDVRKFIQDKYKGSIIPAF